MKIIIDRGDASRQAPTVTIDTQHCHYTYAIREALQLALELDGYTRETIGDVFNLSQDKAEPCEPDPILNTNYEIVCTTEDAETGLYRYRVIATTLTEEDAATLVWVLKQAEEDTTTRYGYRSF